MCNDFNIFSKKLLINRNPTQSLLRDFFNLFINSIVMDGEIWMVNVSVRYSYQLVELLSVWPPLSELVILKAKRLEKKIII